MGVTHPAANKATTAFDRDCCFRLTKEAFDRWCRLTVPMLAVADLVFQVLSFSLVLRYLETRRVGPHQEHPDADQLGDYDRQCGLNQMRSFLPFRLPKDFHSNTDQDGGILYSAKYPQRAMRSFGFSPFSTAQSRT